MTASGHTRTLIERVYKIKIVFRANIYCFQANLKRGLRAPHHRHLSLKLYLPSSDKEVWTIYTQVKLTVKLYQVVFESENHLGALQSGERREPGLFTSISPSNSGGTQTNESPVLAHFESGLFEIRTADQCRLLSAGKTLYIPRGFPYALRPVDTTALGWLLTLPEDRVKNLPNNLSVLRTSDLFLALCRRLRGLGPSESTKSVRTHWELALLYEIETLHVAMGADIPLPRSPSLIAVALKIREFPEDMQPIDYWASKSAMSRRTFTQRFKAETGLTFSIWRQRVKLDAALEMLSSGKSVTETVQRLGYRNMSSFSILFKKQFGMPPRKYLRSKSDE